METFEGNNRWEGRISLWADTCKFERRESISGDMEIEVVVIGAGMTGILTAYMLQSHGIDTVVVEAAETGSGTTGCTTAKITSQHNLIYHKLIKDFGLEKAQQYASANEWAIGNYRRLAEKKSIDCDMEELPSYLFTLEDEHEDIMKAEAEAAAKLGIAATYMDQHDGWGLPFTAKAAVRFDNQLQFHPLKFIKAIANEVKIYENTCVLNVEYLSDEVGVPEVRTKVFTDKGTITTKHLVFACHYPFVNIPGYYFARMHQERSYLLAFSNAGNVRGMYLGTDKSGYTFRNHGDLLIFGGMSHRTGENQAGGHYKSLRNTIKKWYPDAKEEYAWSAQDCISLDAVPYIGRFAESRPTWYVGTGYRKWGMTHSMVAAAIISAMIAKKPLQPGISSFFDPAEGSVNIYSPHRFSMPVSADYLWRDVKTISKSLIKEAFDNPEEQLSDVQPGHGGIVEYKGEKIGVYRDKEGEVYMVDTRCPHMGCQLAWNPEELTWDCPCHGSRFDFHGRLISGPATTNI